MEKARLRGSSANKIGNAAKQAAAVEPPSVASLIGEALQAPSVFKDDGAFDAALLKWRRLGETLLESTLGTEDVKRAELHGDAWNKLGALFASAWPRAIEHGWSAMVEGMHKADLDSDILTAPLDVSKTIHAQVSAWRDAASIVFYMPTRAGGRLHMSAIQDLVAGACGRPCEARMELASHVASMVVGIDTLTGSPDVKCNARLIRSAREARKVLVDAELAQSHSIGNYITVLMGYVTQSFSETAAEAKQLFQSSVIHTEAVFLPGDASALSVPVRDAEGAMHDYIDVMTLSESPEWGCKDIFAIQWEGKFHHARVAARSFFMAHLSIDDGGVAQFAEGLDSATKAVAENAKAAMALVEKSSEKFLRIDPQLLHHRDQFVSCIVEMDRY